jgi:hypothetical protein
MRRKVAVIVGFLVLCLAGTSAWAQYDMRKSTNSYSGMGRSGFALEDRSQKLQEQKAAQQAKQNAAKKNSQNQSAKPQKQPPKTVKP